MSTFLIPVRNEVTGELRIVEILASFFVDAQVEALVYLFRSEGWHKARAFPPGTQEEAAA